MLKGDVFIGPIYYSGTGALWMLSVVLCKQRARLCGLLIYISVDPLTTFDSS